MKIGVVLFQLGGPDSLESIEPFLYNLFCDPDIIDFPLRPHRAAAAGAADLDHARAPAWRTITRRSAARARSWNTPCGRRPRWRRNCARITMPAWRWRCATGTRSPRGHRADWNGIAPDEVVLLPLYPQYSKTTTGSSLNEWQRRFHPNGWAPACTSWRSFTKTRRTCDAVVEAINGTLAGIEDRAMWMSSSARTACRWPWSSRAIRTSGRSSARWSWCGSAAAGRHGGTSATRARWGPRSGCGRRCTRPSNGWRRRSRKHVLVVPISFVSDHVETLHEIDIEHRAQARGLGIEDYRMVPGLNDSPALHRRAGGAGGEEVWSDAAGQLSGLA